ncbi:hypothetical protein ACFO9Q_00010 [Paenibacillus sp. GCM10023252]|uniref:hypothetical protein n=1 Tax=Paenibacillus sp. GCM10023252 TaxID=3252649 RepID=UPI0036230492
MSGLEAAAKLILIRGMLRTVPLLLVLWFGISATVQAAEPVIPSPKGDIYVQDFEQLLSQAEKDELRRLGRALEDKTGLSQK